jgi:divalent metal cation (Fe/Co/Zn/Cd) transporter
LLCDGIAFVGLLFALGFSVHGIISPEQPSDLVIAVVGVKLMNVSFDAVFFVKQRKINKLHNSAISRANYADVLAALLYDGIALVSFFAVWLLRNNPFGLYISPVISIFIAIYLLVECIKRTKIALRDLTDKTLPEEQQMKILRVLTRHYNSYSQLHAINSHKSGNITKIDTHLSFEKDTRVEEVVNLKNQMQDEFESQFGNCVVNVIVCDE